jgi:hypothetical protein
MLAPSFIVRAVRDIKLASKHFLKAKGVCGRRIMPSDHDIDRGHNAHR